LNIIDLDYLNSTQIKIILIEVGSDLDVS